jgi:hypothetical protein
MWKDFRTGLLAAACAVTLAGCGAEKAAPEPPAAPAAAPRAAPAPPPQAPAPQAPAPQAAPSPAPSAARELAPTHADSVAAAAEDVSPEWKQRERSMAGTEQCLRQATDLTGEARTRVEAACRARTQ